MAEAMVNEEKFKQELDAISSHVETQLIDATKKESAQNQLAWLRTQITQKQISAEVPDRIKALRSEIGMPMQLVSSAPAPAPKWAPAPAPAPQAASPAAPAPKTPYQQGDIAEKKQKIREALKSLEPNDIDTFASITEQIVNLPGFEEKYRVLLRGHAGVRLMAMLEQSGYGMIIKSGTAVEVMPLDKKQSSSGHEQNGTMIATKINTLLTAKKMDIDALRTGMLYRTESFAQYARALRGNDGKISGKELDLASYKTSIGLAGRLDPRDWKKIEDYVFNGYDVACYPSKKAGAYDIKIDDSAWNDTIITGVPQKIDLARFFSELATIYGEGKALPSKGEIPYDTIKAQMTSAPVQLSPNEYINILEGKKKKEQLTLTEKMLLASAEAGGFAEYKNMALAVEQFEDFGQLTKITQRAIADIEKGKWAPAKPAGSGDAPASNANTSADSKDAPPAGKSSGTEAPSVVGGTIGQIGGILGKTLGVAASETVKVLTDTFRSASKEGGAWGILAVAALVIGSWRKFGFWNTLLGAGAIGGGSAIVSGKLDDIPGRIEKMAEKLSDIGGGTPQTGNTAPAVPIVPTPPTVTPPENTRLIPSQVKATEKVKSNSDLSQMIEQHANKPNQVENWKLDAYLGFIHSPTFQEKMLDKIIYTSDRRQSIFSNESVMDISMADLPDGINPVLFKKVLRQYLIWSSDLALPATGKQFGDKEYEVFTTGRQQSLYQNKTFKSLAEEIYTSR